MSLASISTSVEQDEWFASAECLGADPETFFVERGGSSAEAKAICRGCPVEEQCFEYAIENNETHGIWGGRSQSELRKIRRQRRMASGDQARRAS
jgi:WhiB family redox-sensing transcriptional regulator